MDSEKQGIERIYGLLWRVFEFCRSVFPSFFRLEITFMDPPHRDPTIHAAMRMDWLNQRKLEKLVEEAKKWGFEVEVSGYDSWLLVHISEEKGGE